MSRPASVCSGLSACGPDSKTCAFCPLSALQDLQLDSDAGVRRAALETLKVLDSCNQHWLFSSPRGLP